MKITVRRIIAVLLIAVSFYAGYFVIPETISKIIGGSTYFVGSIRSDVYHDPDCSYVVQIKPENLINFSSIREAENLGYRPCKVCNPHERMSALFLLPGQVLGSFVALVWNRSKWDALKKIFTLGGFILASLGALVRFGGPEQYISGFLGVITEIPIVILAIWIWQ